MTSPLRRLCAFCSWLFLTLLVVAPAVRADLEIRDIKAAYSALGPERASLEVVPGDEVVFRFLIAGIRTDEAGRCQGELRLRLTSPDGKVLLDNKEAMNGVLALGGQMLPGTARVGFASDMPAGDYKLSVTIRDTLGAGSASFERTLTCTKPAFALVRLRFSQDEAGDIASGAGGILGQTLHIQCKAVGFARTKTKFGVVLTLQVLDTEGKPLMAKPMQIKLSSDDAEQIANLDDFVDFKVQLTLHRVGAFRLHISATDTVSNQKAEFVAPLHVTAP